MLYYKRNPCKSVFLLLFNTEKSRAEQRKAEGFLKHRETEKQRNRGIEK